MVHDPCSILCCSRASDFGLMKIDGNGRICQFLEKPKGERLRTMVVFFFFSI